MPRRVPGSGSAICLKERVDGSVMDPEGATFLQAEALKGHDEPSQVPSRVGDIILVQVDRHRSPPAQQHVLRYVGPVPRARFEAARLRHRGFQLSQQQRGLDAEWPPGAPDLLRPVTDLTEELGWLRETALLSRPQMGPGQPSPATTCSRKPLAETAVKEDLLDLSPLNSLLPQHMQRRHVRRRPRTRDLPRRSEA